jgi:Ceramidase
MTFGEHVYLYCERGTNPELLAEPINAISNAGFFMAALIAWQLLLWRPPEDRSADHYLLIFLAFMIGFGSLAFHLYADTGTELADTVPIGLFMLVYLGFALNRMLGVPPGWTVLIAVGFTVLVGAAVHVQCWDGGIGFAGADVTGAKPCLNGSVGYLPALAALIVIGMILAERHHKAAPYVVWAAIIFTISIILRSLDMALCDKVVVDGRSVGTHFIWHLLNALTLFLLLRASLDAGPVAAIPAVAGPETKEPEPVAAPVVKDKPVETPELASAGEAAVVAGAAKEEAEDTAPSEEPEASETSERAEDTASKKGKSRKKPSFPA